VNTLAGSANTAVGADKKARCTTGDDKSSVGDKYAALTQTLRNLDANVYGSQVNTTTLRSLVVTKLKLLLELHGAELDGNSTDPNDAARVKIRGLYVSNPDAAPQCGIEKDWLTPPADASCGNTTALDGNLVRCSRMAMSHATSAASLEMQSCVEQGAVIDALPDSCVNKATYRAAYGAITTEVLRNALTMMNLSDPPLRQAELRRRMQVVALWYTYMKNVAKEGSSDHWRDASIVAASLVQGAYSNLLAALAKASSSVQGAAILTQGPAVNREVIQVAFPAAPGVAPLPNAPLLLVLANLLQGTSERLDATDFLHDMACRFQDCKTLNTKVVQMHRLLGTFPDEAALNWALNVSPNVSTDWVQAFKSILKRHEILENAVFDVTPGDYGPGLLSDATPSNPALFALGRIAAQSATKSSWYQLSGRFQSANTNTLRQVLLAGNLTYALSNAESNVGYLQGAIADYESNFKANVNDLLDTMHGDLAVTRGWIELSDKVKSIRNLVEELEGSRTNLEMDASSLGNIGDQYYAAVKKLSDKSPTPWVNVTVRQLTVRPQDAKYSGGRLADISELAIPGSELRVGEGDLVQVQVPAEDKYAPTCSLQLANMSPSLTDPDGDPASPYGELYRQYMADPPIMFPSDAQTGSYGYALTASSSSWTATVTTSSNFNLGQVVGQGGQAVATALSKTNPVAAGVIGGASSVFAGIFGRTNTSTQSGSEKRTTASYSVGLRLLDTPFRDAPVGALLAVTVNHADHSAAGIIDVQIVQPNTTLVIDQDADVYLVVNDRSCGPSSSTSAKDGSLGVTMRHLQAIAGFAKDVQPKMADAIAQIDLEAQKRFSQRGSLVATDLSLLRSEAMALLTIDCASCSDPAFVPMMHLFEEMVELELNQVEHRVEIRRLTQALELELDQWQGLAQELAQNQRISQVLSLRGAWSAMNVDEVVVRRYAELLALAVDNELYPFVRAKYPETLGDWLGSSGLQGASVFTALTSYDWTQSWANLARLEVQAVNEIVYQLRSARDMLSGGSANAPGNLPVITIAIPRPPKMDAPSASEPAYQMVPSDGNVYATNYGTPDPEDPSKYLSYVPPARELPNSAEIWANIVANKPATFTIPPEFLYAPANTSQVQFGRLLSCYEAMPVVTSVGMVVVNAEIDTNAALTGNVQPIVLQAGSQQRFVGQTGPVQFKGVNTSWGHVIVNQQYLDCSTGTGFVAGTGAGLSPAGTFTILPNRELLDPPTGSSKARKTVALLLQFQVERRLVDDAVSWIGSYCQ
jgi:hypothetical protein